MKELNLKYPDIKKFILQAVKFGLVGVVNTLITLAAIFVLMSVFSVSYVISNAIGYILGFLNSFVMNKTWTFKSKGSLKKESFIFIVVFIITYVLQLGVLVFLKETLSIEARLAQVIAMVFYTGINFIGNKLFTFKSL